MMTIKDTQAMLSAMDAILEPGEVVFCTATTTPLISAAIPLALATFREAEGLSLILALEDAKDLNLPCDLPMQRITLSVFSSLEGIGLTAAVAEALAEALAEAGIPCNMVAAFHHDHVFVPSSLAETALAVLRRLQISAG
jgi:uncharacterized protein